ncbi:MAG TPA: hypothetical protein VF070_13225 [Streptosporangiaceae bacterium]
MITPQPGTEMPEPGLLNADNPHRPYKGICAVCLQPIAKQGIDGEWLHDEQLLAVLRIVAKHRRARR